MEECRIQNKKNKTLENPIISQIYTLAFHKEQSDYELGIAYYGKTKRRRIMDVIDGCDHLFYIKKLETKHPLGKWSIKSKISPILDTINQKIIDNNKISDELKDVKKGKIESINPFINGLSSKQREKLRSILNKKSFRAIITIEKGIINHYLLLAVIGTIASITYASKRIILSRKNEINLPKGFRTETLIRKMLIKTQKIEPTFKMREDLEKDIYNIVKIAEEFIEFNLPYLLQLACISPISRYTHMAIESSYAFSQLLDEYKRK